jgi:Mitochondrial carrier protein
MAPLASIAFVRTASVSIYSKSMRLYSGMIKKNFGFDVSEHLSKKGSLPNFWSVACCGVAGATAGSAITFVACPFELAKLSAQVSVLMADKENNKYEGAKSREIAASYQNKGTFKTMYNIIQHRGITGLFTGLKLHLRESSPHVMSTVHAMIG